MKPPDSSIDYRKLKGNYRQGISYLDDNYAFFLSQVIGLGRPRWDPATPTAAVGATPKGFEFVFNPDFAYNLNPAQMGFVLAHEALHIALNHLGISAKYPNHTLFNLSADLVINDYLEDQGLELIKGVCRGEEMLGFSCARLTVQEVYQALSEKLGEEIEPALLASQFDDHGWLHEENPELEGQLGQVESQIAQELPPELLSTREDQPKAPSFSLSPYSSLSAFTDQTGVSLAWARLLRQVNPSLFTMAQPQAPSFHRRRRKLGAFREVNLPVKRKAFGDSGKLPSLVMALDTSSSISSHDANLFVTLARSVPKDKIRLLACTFTATYHPLDLDKPEFYRGGTNFSAIEEFIQHRTQSRSSYPKAVIVITDGHADFTRARVKTEHQPNWLWLLTANGKKPHQMSREFFGQAEPLEKYLRYKG